MTTEFPWSHPTTDPVMHLCRLFLGRTDGYAVDNPGTGMRRVDTDPAGIVSAVSAHVAGDASIGVYPLAANSVPWGCIDVDNHAGPLDEALVHNVHRLLEKLGLVVWREVSRSGGAHLWVFASEPVPATVMRHALLAAAQILAVHLDEVNPKQTSAPWGNLVRLPYHGAAVATPSRQVVLDPLGDPMPLRVWVREALTHRNPPAALAKVASLYKPPPPPKAATPAPAVADANRYVAAALQGELEDVSSVTQGGRNLRLYQSALKLGRLVANGQTTPDVIEATLLQAAMANGLLTEDGEHSVLATIRSGIRNGEARHG